MTTLSLSYRISESSDAWAVIAAALLAGLLVGALLTFG